MRSPRAVGLPLALVSALAFGGSGPAARPLLAVGLSPLHIAWMRITGAALVLLPVALRHLPEARRRPLLVLAYGVFPMAGVQACYFAAVSRIPVGVALLIEYLGPVLMLGWVRFVRRRHVSWYAGLGAVLAVGGMTAVVEIWQGMRFDGVGIALALGAAVCQACYFLLGDTGGEPVNATALISQGAVVGAVLISALARPWDVPWHVLGDSAALGPFRWPAYVYVLWIVLVTTVVAYLTGVLAVRLLSPQVAGVVSYLELVVATVLAWLLLGESLTGVQLVGGALVLVGAFVAQMSTPAPDVVVPGAEAEAARVHQT
jgi:drug/metabolite transporter (DMT)-like permease